MRLHEQKPLEVEESVLVFAFRYAITRSSYAPVVIANAISDNFNRLSVETILSIIKEIEEYSRFGSELDRRYWLEFRLKLREMLKVRKEGTGGDMRHDK